MTSKKSLIVNITVIFVVLLSVTNTLAFTIPLIRGRKIDVGQSVDLFSIASSKTYKIHLTKGKTYTIIVTIDYFWQKDYSITLFDSYLLLSGKKVDGPGYTGESFEFTASKTGIHYFSLNIASSFGTLIVREGSYGSTAQAKSFFNVANLFLYLLPEILLLPIFLIIIFLSLKIQSAIARNDSKKTSAASAPYSPIYKPYISSSPLTITKSEEERIEDFKRILKRYVSISLEELAKILDFRDIISLQDWLINLPESIPFQVFNDRVFFQNKLQTDEKEREKTAKTLAKSLIRLQEKTCYYCGMPLDEKAQTCSSCEREVLYCNVCKLPISFGEQAGKCPKCGTIGHLAHLQEWLKVKGKCPYCQCRLLPEEVIILDGPPSKKKA